MADRDETIRDLADMLHAVITWGATDPRVYADRVCARLGIGEDDSAEAVEGVLRQALGIPGPRTVTFDMADSDSYLVLDSALEEFATWQRDRARNEGGNIRRDQWVKLADDMRGHAEAARNARDPNGKEAGS